MNSFFDRWADFCIKEVLSSQGLSKDWLKDHVKDAKFNKDFTEIQYNLLLVEPIKHVTFTFDVNYEG